MSALMTVSELARAVAALDTRGDGRIGFSSVSTDTRTLAPGALYVALRGERFDGHDYVAAAREGGAAAT
jgi:UDP-N-acetylmuramoyl-tripeptide--D-alanyl-D-alanine ligase